MKVKSLYNVMPKETKVFICRNLVNQGEVIDVEVMFKGTFAEIPAECLQIWTDNVCIEASDECLVIMAKDKECVVDGETVESFETVSGGDGVECSSPSE